MKKPDFVLHFTLRKKRIWILATTLLVALVFPPIRAYAEELLCGIDRLDASECRELSGLRVALISNTRSHSKTGESSYALLIRHGVKLKYLMAPEHGFLADTEAGKAVGRAVVSDTIPVFSLYGASKKPDIQQLRKIDLLLFDLQDIGTRCYTYISTMKYAMEACEQAGIAFMVLDRPNPVAPLAQSGFMVTSGYDSFVGAVNIPFLHAMTVGEIAMLLQKQYYQRLDLRVISMQGYQRSKFGDEQEGFTFQSPSPNIRNVETAIVYPATVFLEATPLSEGRGTDAPFMQFGAPFINSDDLLLAVSKYKLPGITFKPVLFTPHSSKFSEEICHGLKLGLTDRRVFSPLRTATVLLLELQRLYPLNIRLDKNGRFFDQLAGSPLFREMIVKQQPVEAIMEESLKQREAFNRSIPANHLLYQ
ncbi:MAG: DUF1343 domain-containing protein [Chlorobium sp.]|nr:MAG: DUF1343 domain-containing protein [Chlorobium sp.]